MGVRGTRCAPSTVYPTQPPCMTTPMQDPRLELWWVKIDGFDRYFVIGKCIPALPSVDPSKVGKCAPSSNGGVPAVKGALAGTGIIQPSYECSSDVRQAACLHSTIWCIAQAAVTSFSGEFECPAVSSDRIPVTGTSRIGSNGRNISDVDVPEPTVSESRLLLDVKSGIQEERGIERPGGIQKRREGFVLAFQTQIHPDNSYIALDVRHWSHVRNTAF
jgi:hypothetical protein